MERALRTRALVGAAAVLLLALAPSPALASCLQPPPPPDVAMATNEVVFVGTVAETSNEARTATVRVLEVRKGPPLPPTVEVRGAHDDALGGFSSIDRTFRAGTTYLFFPKNGAPPFRDDACTATRVHEAPAGGGGAEDGPDQPGGTGGAPATDQGTGAGGDGDGDGDGTGPVLLAGAAGVAVLAAGAVAVAARRRAAG